MRCVIEKLDHFGRGIAFINNKIIFIKNALPGEEVEVKIIKENNKLSEGIVLDYINKSDDRVEPKCPYFDKCGGCDLLNLNYEHQLKYKENKVKEIMHKFSNLNCVNKIVPSEQYNYRNKVTLHVNNKLGYYLKNTNSIINIDKCLIVDDKINNVIKILNNLNLIGISQIMIRVSEEEVMLDIDGNINFDISKLNTVDTIINNGKILTGKGYILEKLDNYRFNVSNKSFYQVNNLGMLNIYNKVLNNIDENSSTLDLYCGTGTIGIYVSNKCKSVLGIEINEQAIKDANKNKLLNNIKNIDFKCGDVGKVLNQTKFNADNIIVDPPRAGLDKMSIDNILKIAPKKIIYVSCNPVTLARDLNILKEQYDVLEITPFDMFPNTYHVECVCLLHRKTLE